METAMIVRLFDIPAALVYSTVFIVVKCRASMYSLSLFLPDKRSHCYQRSMTSTLYNSTFFLPPLYFNFNMPFWINIRMWSVFLDSITRIRRFIG